MSVRIIAFKQEKYGKSYYASLSKIRQLVAELEDEAYGLTVDMALCGPWKIWADDQPIGTEINIKLEHLYQTGGTIRELALLVDYLGGKLAYIDDVLTQKHK